MSYSYSKYIRSDNFRDTTLLAALEGRPFDRWTDYILGVGRSNGMSENNLIQCPPYIIESLLRDENFVERDLTLEYVSDNTFYVDGLKVAVDDHYDYAIIYNVSKNEKDYVSDFVYTGGHKRINTAGAHAGWQTGDFCFLANIQGDLKIDFASFDVVGNTTNGLRGTTATKWIFGRTFTQKQNIRNILDELCFESHCELIESVSPDTGLNSFKLIALDSGTGDTWTNPAYSNGLEQITARLSPLESVFTQFRLRYYYDYGKNDFSKEIYLDKHSLPASATILSSTEQDLCSDAETNFGVSQLFEYLSKNIYDDATAERMLQKKIQWFSKQRFLVDYTTPIVGNSDWIKYEVGDQVKLNFSQGIPTGLNNSAMFMITDKNITPLLGGGFIRWQLIEIG